MTSYAGQRPDPRARLIKLIHVARRDLGLDDDAYRLMLTETTGQASSKVMSIPELQRVLDRLKAGGFKVKRPARAADDPQARKIRALWLTLHSEGKVRNPSEAALNAYVQRQTRVARIEWLSTGQCSAVIEALKQWMERP
jgi:phage gp16-like protein